jgi:hypothetical protein
LSKEIYFSPSLNNNAKDDLDTMDWNISSHTINEYEESFVAKHQDCIHGIIQGNAFLICDESLIIEPILEENNGCLNLIVPIIKPIVDTIFFINSKIKSGINLLSTKLFGKRIINDLDNNAGCLNSMLPTGCTSSGCSSFGCGCLSLITAFLFLLFGFSSLFKSCNEDKLASEYKNTNRDTVYIEKKIYDTVKITKTDTLKFENNITKTNYESVNLPNVQFKTNEAELLLNKNGEGWQTGTVPFGIDTYDFSVFPAGCRLFSGEITSGYTAFFWTATSTANGHAYYRYFDYLKKNIFRQTTYPQYGMSIRCVKD